MFDILRFGCRKEVLDILDSIFKSLILFTAFFMLGHHRDGPGGALFCADTASLAEIIIDLYRDGLGYNSLGAIHPTKETGLFPRF